VQFDIENSTRTGSQMLLPWTLLAVNRPVDVLPGQRPSFNIRQVDRLIPKWLKVISHQDSAFRTQRGLAVLPFDTAAQLNDLASQLLVWSDLYDHPSRKIVSSAKIGRRNRTQNSKPNIAPFFEKCDAVSARSNAVVWGPLAVGLPKRVVAANSASWCIGLSSPAAFANSITVAGESVTSEENRSRG
jgi:hypothetical protein